MASFHPAVRGSVAEDNEPPPASLPAAAPQTCPGVLITSLMRVALFNELLAGLGTVTVTPQLWPTRRPRGQSRTRVHGEITLLCSRSLGHCGNAGAEQDQKPSRDGLDEDEGGQPRDRPSSQEPNPGKSPRKGTEAAHGSDVGGQSIPELAAHLQHSTPLLGSRAATQQGSGKTTTCLPPPQREGEAEDKEDAVLCLPVPLPSAPAAANSFKASLVPAKCLCKNSPSLLSSSASRVFTAMPRSAY